MAYLTDYPGVSPDGRGGLSALGSIFGSNILEHADYFFGGNTDGVAVPSGGFNASFLLPITDVRHTTAAYSLSLDLKRVTLVKPGIYLVIFTSFLDSGTIGAGQMLGVIDSALNAGDIAGEAQGAAVDAGYSGGWGIQLCVSDGTNPLGFDVRQNSGADIAVDAFVAILRLGSL